MNVIFSLFVIFFIAALYFTDRPTDRPPLVNNSPESEKSFIDVLQMYRYQWQRAPNDIQREPIRANRDRALCNLPLTFKNWRGKIRTAPRTLWFGDDQEIGMSLSIWSDANDAFIFTNSSANHGGIQRNTQLFNKVSQLMEGQTITFSGHFVELENGCIKEDSFTDNGSLTSPEFRIVFDDVTP
jgi:hypothetical protein